MTPFDPAMFCDEIASNPDAKAVLLANANFGCDEFVNKQSLTIHAHYANACETLTVEDARTAAAKLWRYIQWLRQIRLSAMSRPPASATRTTKQLREQAEAQLGANIEFESVTETGAPETTAQLIHELRVHQIELELQNEELRQTQEALDIARARYFDLYDLAPVGYVILSEAGSIEEANLAATFLLTVSRSHLVGVPLTRFILPEDQDIFYHSRRQLWSTGAGYDNDSFIFGPQGCHSQIGAA